MIGSHLYNSHPLARLDWFAKRRFRPFARADEQFTETIRACKPQDADRARERAVLASVGSGVAHG